MNSQPLSGRVALVAGATRGAGRGSARALAEAGAVVYCTGRSTAGQASEMGRTETIEETASIIERAGGRAFAAQVDHTDESAVADLAQRIRSESGRLDILVNSSEVRGRLLDEINGARELLGELIECEQIGVRLQTLSSPMCPRFHVDNVPCRMLITLCGAGTEWISNNDVDWEVLTDLDTVAPPLKPDGSIQNLNSGYWSLLKGGAWSEEFGGVVHRSPHGEGDRLLLSLDPIF